MELKLKDILKPRNPLTESKQDKEEFRKVFGDELTDTFLKQRSKMLPPQNDFYYWIKLYNNGDGMLTLDEIKRLINNYKSNKQYKREEDRGESELIANLNGWKVRKILDYAAAKYYANRNTKWCISSRDEKEGQHYFDFYIEPNEEYTGDGPYYSDIVLEDYYFITSPDNHMWCYLLYYKDANGDIINRLFNEEDHEVSEEASGIPQEIFNVIPEPESMEPHIMGGIREHNDYMYPNFNFNIKDAVKNIKLNNNYKYQNNIKEGIIDFELNFNEENEGSEEWVEINVCGQYRHRGLYTLEFEWNIELEKTPDLLDSLKNDVEECIPEDLLNRPTWNDFANGCVCTT